MKTLLLISIALLLSATNLTANGSDWPAWRGAERTGQVSGPEWPTNLDNLKAKWTVPLGKSYSSPIIANDRVFVFETTDEKTVTVRALNRADGSELWKKSWASSFTVPGFALANGSWVKSTPAWNGKTLFVGDMREVLVAFDGVTGEEKWRIDFPETYGTQVPPFGFSSSPLAVDDKLYVQAVNSVFKLEAATGEVVWRAMSGHNPDDMSQQGAFSSPVLTTLADKEQLLIMTRASLNGIDPQNGDQLWSEAIPHFRGCLIVTPTVYGEGIFTSSFRNGSYFYNLSADEGKVNAEQVWSNKISGYMSSPIVIGGYAYMHLTNNRMACIDLKTGETTWTTTGKFSKYASMIWQDDRILVLAADGMLHLLEANPKEFTSIASQKVAEGETWAYLGISGSELYVRELEGLTVYTW
ncbi:MAG: PQQ-binding-like beta-propeller repeat protein [Calditrichia bacterium]